MIKEETEAARFIFGIREIRSLDGQFNHQTRTSNSGISTEIVIIRLRAYLEILEKDYFEDFEKSSARFKEE